VIRHFATALLTGVLLSKVAWAQTDVGALEKSLKGKPMPLRSYSADPIATYQWANNVLQVQPAKLHTFALFTTQSVKLKKDKLVFDGKRTTLVVDESKQKVSVMGEMPMKLELDLNGADPASVIPQLQEMLFFPNLKTATEGLPALVADQLPFDISRSQKIRDSVLIFDNGRWTRQDRESPKMTPPTIVSWVEPEFTERARQARVNGTVALILYVSETGKAGDIWIAVPLGFDLDEKAADAVRRYVFKPELCDGHPVGTSLRVEVNFQIF
jgi:TonB family protein